MERGIPSVELQSVTKRFEGLLANRDPQLAKDQLIFPTEELPA